MPDPESLGEALWVRADLELWAGRPRAALVAADEYRDRFAGLNVTETARFIELTAAWARCELGLGAATEVFPQRHELTAGSTAEVQALTAYAGADWRTAATCFAEAASAWRGRNVRHECRCDPVELH